VPGEVYHGGDIRIEVRDSEDPYIAAVKATGDEVQFSTSFRLVGTLSLVMLFAAIVLACAAGYFVHNLKKFDAPYSIQNDAPLRT
jgi:hypothetical protein